MKSTPPVNESNLNLCWNKNVDEDLASSALKENTNRNKTTAVASNAAVKSVIICV